jgi:hypothetical protein
LLLLHDVSFSNAIFTRRVGPGRKLPSISKKKFIEFGWDVPGAEFVRDSIRQMEKRPLMASS